MATVLTCTECGIELDQNDVDANMATWGVFKSCCSDCVELVDPPVARSYVVSVPKGVF